MHHFQCQLLQNAVTNSLYVELTSCAIELVYVELICTIGDDRAGLSLFLSLTLSRVCLACCI